MSTSDQNTSNNNDKPIAVAEVLTDGQTTPQLELTKEALIMLFVPASNPRLKKDPQPRFTTSKVVGQQILRTLARQ